MARITYDRRADALYVYLTTEPVARTEVIDDSTIVDLDAAGRTVGIEILGASKNVPVLVSAHQAALEALRRLGRAQGVVRWPRRRSEGS